MTIRWYGTTDGNYSMAVDFVIVTDFVDGQEVWGLCDKLYHGTVSGRRPGQVLIYYGDGSYGDYGDTTIWIDEDRVFASREEAGAALEEASP